MPADPNAIDQAVSRTLRDNLEKIQRTAEELNQAVLDLVAACASSRPSNALPSMIRAQTSAASLSATFDVLSRFVTAALQPPLRLPFEPETIPMPRVPVAAPVAAPLVHEAAVSPAPPEQQEPVAEHLIEDRVEEETPWVSPASPAESPVVLDRAPDGPEGVETPTESSSSSELFEMPPAAEFSFGVEPVFLSEPVPVFIHEPSTLAAPELADETHDADVGSDVVEAAQVFRLDSLAPEEQELHRRAYRVAKVSMQDIKMLRPEDVRVGRENRDLCYRLRDDIEKAHKEYDRRFHSIQSHPVDYFYDWMVEILGGGDPEALGEYPYPSPVMRR
jgi:uncharacterized damage-inducible protein DinB